MFVETIKRLQGYKIACLKEISWRSCWLINERVAKMVQTLNKNRYSKHLASLLCGMYR
jgi:glucose-1-phosphate thymidylyltransferase